MKTKEIEVWVDSANLEKNGFYVNREKVDFRPSEIKARLIIELPEKKIEITESDFDHAWTMTDHSNSKSVYKELKDKLFGGVR